MCPQIFEESLYYRYFFTLCTKYVCYHSSLLFKSHVIMINYQSIFTFSIFVAIDPVPLKCCIGSWQYWQVFHLYPSRFLTIIEEIKSKASRHSDLHMVRTKQFSIFPFLLLQPPASQPSQPSYLDQICGLRYCVRVRWRICLVIIGYEPPCLTIRQREQYLLIPNSPSQRHNDCFNFCNVVSVLSGAKSASKPMPRRKIIVQRKGSKQGSKRCDIINEEPLDNYRNKDQRKHFLFSFIKQGNEQEQENELRQL